jgi:hypothetical protein
MRTYLNYVNLYLFIYSLILFTMEKLTWIQQKRPNCTQETRYVIVFNKAEELQLLPITDIDSCSQNTNYQA